ncbi:MAG: EamA/RhaT family transporter [Planctomycetota bacterium]
MHLLFPLLASILFVCGLLLLKVATRQGANPWTVSLIANWWASLAFSGFWFIGETPVPWSLIWQPAMVAVLFILGQIGTFLAITHGDVSIAAPLFGLKVLFVAFLVTLFGGQTLPITIWIAAVFATIGIGLVQSTGKSEHTRVIYTVLSAIGASSSFSIFDVLVQRFCSSEHASWEANRFLPIMFWFVAIYSVIFLTAFQRKLLRSPEVRRSLLGGGLLIALQALCVVFTLSNFGDAPRVNVVYATRGIWGVVLAWAAAKIWGGAESELTRGVMLMRLCGATLITLGVILAIIAG